MSESPEVARDMEPTLQQNASVGWCSGNDLLEVPARITFLERILVALKLTKWRVPMFRVTK